MSVTIKELGVYDAKSATALTDPDGKSLVIEFQMEEDQRIRFSLGVEQARELLYRMSFVAAASLKEPTALGGSGFVRMTKVKTADAKVTDGDGGVALGLIDEQGIPHYFVMNPETSAALRPQLQSAEAGAKQGVQIPRA